ncbi:MAG: NADPH:quinone reductase [Phycisphaerales bacterium]|nr:NADPH:quinone reductase [Phycisphaerales bacterium]
MKAVRVHQFGDPSVLKPELLPDPPVGPKQVLVRVHAVGVNPVDTYIRSGIYGAREFPFVPGFDAAGVVERVGAEQKAFKQGDRVVVYRPPGGTYTKLISCGPEYLFPLPHNLSFEEGAALGVPYFSAHLALFVRGRAKAGETVLVHGATGGVGIAAVQLARAAGLRVFGTGSTERGRQLAVEQGAAKVFDHGKAGYIEEIRAATDGKGPDLIVEMLANVNLENDLGLAAMHGRIVIIGSRGKIEITPRHTMKNNIDVMGMGVLNATNEELHGAWESIRSGIDAGKLRPIIGEKFSLDDAAKAHAKVMEPGAFGKIVLIP